jgi:hypothetical protein
VGEYVSVNSCEWTDVPPKMSDAMRAELLAALQSVHTEIVQWDTCMCLFECDLNRICDFLSQ